MLDSIRFGRRNQRTSVQNVGCTQVSFDQFSSGDSFVSSGTKSGRRWMLILPLMLDFICFEQRNQRTSVQNVGCTQVSVDQFSCGDSFLSSGTNPGIRWMLILPLMLDFIRFEQRNQRTSVQNVGYTQVSFYQFLSGDSLVNAGTNQGSVTYCIITNSKMS